ncbi:MAG: nucleotidyl transferase AbiEii/AbiGii toxin family protein [candidate division NC10 bacterium]|nr:nucleotidyl transferase AbiEii/AbiGii toxin family protein [candidate division NC10 bacterium]
MRYSREYLERLAAQTGYRPDALEKVLRLERFLNQISRHPFLGTRLVLKGGTAVNLFFYGKAPRLSVDLDFNYIGALDREKMLHERADVERALEQIAVGEGYKIQRGAEEHAGRKFFLGYWSGLGTQDRIEVDLNYMFRVSLVPVELREGWTPDPDSPCRVRVAGLEEVMAGKLVAFLDRVAAKDLYDVATFVSDPPPHDTNLLRSLFVALSGTLPRALTTYGLEHLEAFTQKVLEIELAPFLREGEPVEIAALKSSVAPTLSKLLALSAGEREYVERLQWGGFLPERVVGSRADLLDLLRGHPALLWKIENAKKRMSE